MALEQDSPSPITKKDNDILHEGSAISTTDSTIETNLDPLLDILSEPEVKRRSGVKWIVASGALLTIGIAGWLGYNRFAKAPVEPLTIPTMPAQVGDVEVTITESGTVELDGQQTFKSPGDVTVEAVLVQERQRVSVGTVLLQLRDRGVQQELINQEIQSQKNANSLARRQEVIQERREKLQKAQERFADSQDLFNRGFISEDAYRQDEESVEDALSAIKDAEVELTNAQLDIQNNQLELENILTRLADSQIVAPMDAVVLNVEVRPGDGVSQGGDLLTIGDPFKEVVRLSLSTLNAAKVQLNMPVEVSLIGPESQTFSGRIARVSPQVSSDESSGRGESQGVVEAEAILNTPSNGTLIPGGVVSVEITLEAEQAVVTVPLTALQSDGVGRFVWVKDEQGNAEKRPVEVGLENLQVAAIASGLKAGEEIVPALPPEVEIVPGMPLAEGEEGLEAFSGPPER